MFLFDVKIGIHGDIDESQWEELESEFDEIKDEFEDRIRVFCVKHGFEWKSN